MSLSLFFWGIDGHEKSWYRKCCLYVSNTAFLELRFDLFFHEDQSTAKGCTKDQVKMWFMCFLKRTIWKVKWQFLEDFPKYFLKKIKLFSVECGQRIRARYRVNSRYAQLTARKHATPLIIQIDGKYKTLSWTESYKCPVPLIIYHVVYRCSKILYL